jgi:hypothetical protein
MGCYDSFYVNKVEIQTKELTCTLNSYRLGDTVITDDGTTNFYIIEEDPELGFVGLIVLNGIYASYSINKSKDGCKFFAEWCFQHHFEKGNDTSRMFANLIKDSINPRLYQAEKKLSEIQQAITTHEAYLKNPESNSIFSFLKFWDNFKAGESVSCVIKNIMEGNK